MTSTELIDRIYGLLARSRAIARLAVHTRGISTAVLAKRLAPATLPSLNGEYWLLEQLGDVRVAIDAGANVGEWSEQAVQSWPNLELLICFEPVQWAAEELTRRLGSDSRVELVPCALSDRPGTVTMWQEPVGGTMSSAVAGYSADTATPIVVEAVTLDDELERRGIERVDFLKIDVEGLDLHVLRGAVRALQAQRIGVVQFEYGCAWQRAGSTLRAAYALLADAGYRTLLVTPDGLRDFPLDAMTELYAYANFVGLSPKLASRFEPVEAIW